MEQLLLAKFDLGQFLWKDNASHELSRPLAGSEVQQDSFNRFGKGDQMLFLGIHIDLAAPVAEKHLVDASRDAWMWLRFHVPTIASLVTITEDGNPSLVYRLATAEQVAAWAGKTFLVTKQEQIDLHTLRHQLGQQKIPTSEGLQTWLHLVPGPVNAGGQISSFALLFQTHHTPFDGTGIKILASRYLRQLASSLTAPAASQLQWGKEDANLLPAAFNILAPTSPLPIPPDSAEEPSFAHPYYGSLAKVMTDLGEATKNPYGFKPRNGDAGWPSNRREEIVFTKEQSDKILQALQSSSTAPGSKAITVTHLAHAALCMVVMADNPPTPEAKSQYMNNYHLSDCRHVLKEPYNTREGYPGYVLGISCLRVPVTLYMTEDDNPAPLNKATLDKATQAMRDIYAAEKAIPAPLVYMGQAAQIFAMSMKQAVASGQPPPVNNCYSIASDGLGEKYLDHTYADSTGKVAFSVTKFFTSVNRTDPGPFFRISSWRGAIDISVDYNANVIATADVKKYLEDWKKYILMAAGI